MLENIENLHLVAINR